MCTSRSVCASAVARTDIRDHSILMDSVLSESNAGDVIGNHPTLGAIFDTRQWITERFLTCENVEPALEVLHLALAKMFNRGKEV